jgi:hypothetical protein
VGVCRDPIFSSDRTGAATAISREDLRAAADNLRSHQRSHASDTSGARQIRFQGRTIARTTLQWTVSYFNSAFGSRRRAAGRQNRCAAPISLESIEQVQVSVAPYDVRQGNFNWSGGQYVTRSGTKPVECLGVHAVPNQDYVGTEAQGLAVNPGRLRFGTPV